MPNISRKCSVSATSWATLEGCLEHSDRRISNQSNGFYLCGTFHALSSKKSLTEGENVTLPPPHICTYAVTDTFTHTRTLNPHIQQLSLPVYQRWDAHFIANKDNICLSLFYFRFNRNQLYWQVVKHFSAAHLRPPVVKYSHYTSYRFTLCLTFIVTLFLLYCRCILKVQIWPFGPGGPVALQEGEMLVLPSANADERRRSDCRHAERGPRGDRLRVLSG